MKEFGRLDAIRLPAIHERASARLCAILLSGLLGQRNQLLPIGGFAVEPLVATPAVDMGTDEREVCRSKLGPGASAND